MHREISLMVKVHHPNLLFFMAAVLLVSILYSLLSYLTQTSGRHLAQTSGRHVRMGNLPTTVLAFLSSGKWQLPSTTHTSNMNQSSTEMWAVPTFYCRHYQTTGRGGEGICLTLGLLTWSDINYATTATPGAAVYCVPEASERKAISKNQSLQLWNTFLWGLHLPISLFGRISFHATVNGL